ncbi:MAG TPA: M14 family metallopeptidase [Solirubrobacteraceae bacterium]|nr:M14 family metallopeptidase [Solirubrobacteraceae bacterium]
MPYLNVVEVESALATAAGAPFTGFTELITLPNTTWEGRTCHAIKIASGGGSRRPGVYFLGGVHSREWGSSDILINFIEQLENAYQSGTGLSFGPRSFSAADISAIVETLDIIVFPQTNPDGRNYSMTVDAMWRKNRRTVAPNSPVCPGVDVNRNYDFLWDFPHYFSPSAPISDSTDPCDHPDQNNGTYHGPGAFSEPETRNARWIFDTFSNVGFFIDLHSYGEDILYSWGDDEDQSNDPTMNFANPGYDGQRGVAGDAYKEFIPSDDLAASLALAGDFHDAVQAVRGTNYTVKSAFDLYPTAGTSDDYAYSRHFADASKSNIISYTLEWGTEFQPPYAEMQNIIEEITCGLVAFCLHVRNSITSCVVVTDRSSFGKDEVEALLHQGGPAAVPAAFYVMIDGFRASDLGISSATLSGTPDVAPAIGFNPGLGGVPVPRASSCIAEDAAHLSFPQRFTWVYPMTFTDTSDFDQESRPITLSASMTSSSGITVGGSAVLTFTTQPNPYEIDGQTSWLSVDLQVFHLAEGGSLPSTPGIVCNAGPIDFITRLLANTGGSYNDPALTRAPNHPFDVDLLAHADTSTVTTAGTIGFIPVYNFAVARVRYRALSTPAAGVRCFFRLFNCSTISTDFQPATTYLTGGLGGSKVPLLGVLNNEVVSIPCFASDRVDPTNVNGLNAQPDPVNVGPVGESIPPDGSGAEVQVYFGCWLDINQTTHALPPVGSSANGNGPYTPARSVQEAIRGSHQCLVAEINMDPPEPQISTGQTPASSDKLAQRNLTIVPIASPHQAPTTFDIKPTPANEPSGATPDEIMFEWDELPHGSTAQIYLPGTSANEILALADKLYLRHDLVRHDAHTVTCAARGITYMPVPPGSGSNYAGLLTVEVPPTAERGRTYKVVTRQLRNTAARLPLPPPPPPASVPVPGIAHTEAVTAVNKVELIRWRRVIGSFQLSIPVQTKPAILPDEERLLSVSRFIFRSIPTTERWHPVWKRYVDQIARRVSALGGDPDQISASSSGESWKHLPAETHHRQTGKIAGLIFDRYGDFEGFILDTDDGQHKYLTREKNMAELVQRAWRERLRITVGAEHHDPHHPQTITLLQPPVSLED